MVSPCFPTVVGRISAGIRPVWTYLVPHLSLTQQSLLVRQPQGRKRERYSGLTDRYLFEPVAVETGKTFGTSTLKFLKFLGKRITSQTGDKRETRWMLNASLSQ